jgi:hypothetical protein
MSAKESAACAGSDASVYAERDGDVRDVRMQKLQAGVADKTRFATEDSLHDMKCTFTLEVILYVRSTV